MAENSGIDERFYEKQVSNNDENTCIYKNNLKDKQCFNKYNFQEYCGKKHQLQQSIGIESPIFFSEEQSSMYGLTYGSDTCKENQFVKNKKTKKMHFNSNCYYKSDKTEFCKEKALENVFGKCSQNNSDMFCNKDDSFGGAIAGSRLSNIAQCISGCTDKNECLSLEDILKSFNAAISEEQAWALIYQSVKSYRDAFKIQGFKLRNIRIPENMKNFRVNKDGNIHITCTNDMKGGLNKTVTSYKKISVKLGTIIYSALDFKLSVDEVCMISNELEELISYMTVEDNDDEGIERDSEENEGERYEGSKELNYILEVCERRIKPPSAEDHYKAVCRAIFAEVSELKIFLRKVFQGDTESLRIRACGKTSKQELENLGFNDWARFWMQVVEELRKGVRLRKNMASSLKTSVEYELTPYEILMEDIRARNYNLRKVMVNGDMPQKVEMDAHAVILEFIKSRPPLKKVSERKLALPTKKILSARDQLMASIRIGRPLKPTQTQRKNRLLPVSQAELGIKSEESQIVPDSSKSCQRLIKVDYSLFQNDDYEGPCSMPLIVNKNSIQMPLYPISDSMTGSSQKNMKASFRGIENPIAQDEYHKLCDTILESYDLATQCESRRSSIRRHTIVGCQSKYILTNSISPSQPKFQQLVNNNVLKSSKDNDLNKIHNFNSKTTSRELKFQKEQVMKNNQDKILINSKNIDFKSMDTWTKSLVDENQWADKINDRLSLTLEEIVHIRSVMTNAELEGLPVGVRVKEDVERRKVCFLCLRTRFSLFGPWGMQCKLCQRTVCSKCHTKMRIPTEHFRNIPVILLSPSLASSPESSNAPSPSHRIHTMCGSRSEHSVADESFPKSLIEKLLKNDSNRKIRNSVSSAPSSPKHQRSTTCLQNESLSTIETNSLINADDINRNNNAAFEVPLTSKKSSSTFTKRTTNRCVSIMSKSMEGPRSRPIQSPTRPHSNSSTLDRRNRFARALTFTAAANLTDQKENSLRGDLMTVCNDCRSLVLEIIRSARQTRSSARNQALKHLTLDLSPVYKQC